MSYKPDILSCLSKLFLIFENFVHERQGFLWHIVGCVKRQSLFGEWAPSVRFLKFQHHFLVGTEFSDSYVKTENTICEINNNRITENWFKLDFLIQLTINEKKWTILWILIIFLLYKVTFSGVHRFNIYSVHTKPSWVFQPGYKCTDQVEGCEGRGDKIGLDDKGLGSLRPHFVLQFIWARKTYQFWPS